MYRGLVFIFGWALTGTSVSLGADASLLWSDKVQSLFDVQCVKCHGPIEQKSDLELDTPEAVLRGGYEGEVVVPGHPEKSRLYQYLAADSDPHMPPKKQLTEAERGLVRDWIMALGQASADPASSAHDSPEHAQSAESYTFKTPSQAIDTLVAKGWERRGVPSAPPADDRTWCRRVYLDLAGRIPTFEELSEFLYSPETHKRRALVDRLLQSEAHAVHMRELWDVYLLGRGKRRNHEDRRRDNGWWSFLEQAFRENRPWNEVVSDMLVARPRSPEAKGATWFLYERRDRHQQIAEAVAPLVYGTKIDCAQCHDHPLAREIKQAHYWGLVAAFNRSKNIRGTTDIAESAVGGYVNFTNLKKESQPAKIALLTGQTVAESWPEGEEKEEEDRDDNYVDPNAKVRIPKYSRRAAFAEAATEGNSLLARAFVNRMWGTLIGRGIVHPVDEMNARNAPSHPELLDWLAKDFAGHHYDIRRLVRGIVLSRVYALSNRNVDSASVSPEAFTVSLERPLTAEQIARSWRVAAGVSPVDDDLRRAVIEAMPDVLPKDYNATFQQAQFLAGSPELLSLLKPAPGNTVERLAEIGDPESAAREAFLSVFGRWPDAEELGQASEFLRAQSEHPVEGTGDLLWALMTSAEFLTAP